MPTYKLSVDGAFDEMLSRLANSDTQAPEARTKEQVIRNAVALYVYLHKAVAEAEGRNVAIIDENMQIVKIIDPLP